MKRPCSESDSSTVQSKLLRSSSQPFDWKAECFFCSKLSHVADKLLWPKGCTDIGDLENALEMCAKRLSLSKSDVVALEIHHCLMTCSDLVAEEAVYRRKCHADFFLFPSPTACTVGHPLLEDKEEGFEKLCYCLKDTADSWQTEWKGGINIKYSWHLFQSMVESEIDGTLWRAHYFLQR